MKNFKISKFSLTFLLIEMLNYFPTIAAEDKKESLFPSKCASMFKVEKDFADIWSTCAKSLKLEKKLKEFSMNDAETLKYFEQLEKSDFDDKCIGKCVAEKTGILTADGHINKDTYSALEAKHEGTPEAKKIFKGIWMACADKIESKTKDDGGIKGKECKYMAMYRHCLFMDSLKKRDELEAAC